MRSADLDQLLVSIPRKRLIFLPTPFHRLDRLSGKYGADLYIKRDDLTGPSVFGGNKTRKLEFIFGSALAQGIEYFISVGPYQTNSGMELAQCCRKCGVKPILYLFDLHNYSQPGEYRANLLLNKIMQCEIHLEHPKDGEDVATMIYQKGIELAGKRKEELERKGHKAMVLPAGVTAPEGLLAYVLGFKEIIEQCEAMGISLDYVFHATGTGGSLPGLLAGKLILASKVKIISIAISPPSRPVGKELICSRVEDIFRRLGITPPPRETILNEINIDYNYVGKEYAIPTQAGSDAIKELAYEEGLMLDPVYTGKAFSGLLDYVRSRKLPPNSRLAFLHTGGCGAIFAEKDLTGKLY